ncbi:hypothetical protein [Cellulomonas xiejunii]|uniref:hypothetical protein n=1 Tax=Cellulomonas xiejunii TaxID=2968083 RepID=UPI001D0EC61A|nr:hypothetical protein [Cellulomonas xiejunii]MCC2315315.1 hypothetical protein [Cellulomonas xiejunii]
MSGDVRARPASDGAIGLVVPADWWVVPLADEAERGRVIAAMVDHQVGAGDEYAALRRRLRVDVGAAARRAAARDGWVIAFMLMHAAGHPLPATMIGYRSPGSFRDEAGVADVRAALEDVAAMTGGRVEAGAGPFGVVLRAVRVRTGSWHGVADLPLLACDHWTDPGDGHGLVHLAFTTPLVALREPIGELFDAVASTLHRSDPVPGDDHPEPGDPCGAMPAPSGTRWP